MKQKRQQLLKSDKLKLTKFDYWPEMSNTEDPK